MQDVVQDVVQWQKTAHSLKAKSVGKHLRKYFHQHMVQLADQTVMSLSFGLGSALLPYHSL